MSASVNPSPSPSPSPLPFLIGIAGGTGSGKTTVATKIVDSLPPGQAALIEHDSYYRDRGALTPAERARINFDEPDALENDLLVAHLQALKRGVGVPSPRYDFATHTRQAETQWTEPRPVIVVEGILLFSVPSLRDLFDLRLFVDTPDDVRLLRRIKRDLLERGRDIASVEAQYLETVRVMHERYVAPAKRYAHLVIPEGGDNAQALDVIVGSLAALIVRRVP